jgi:hypothetical protein
MAATLLLLVGAGCGSSSKKAKKAPLGPAVAWTSQQPPQFAAREPVRAFCRGDELTMKGEAMFVPHFSGGVALVTLRNTSSHACRLTGRPVVTFVKTGGPVQVDSDIQPTPANFPETTYPASSLAALQPGEAGAVTITWDNWCDPVVKGKPHVPPSAIRIALPHGRGHVDGNYNAVPACVDPKQPTTIGVSVFQPSLIAPAKHAWTEAFVRGSIPGQPVHARRGGILRFRVVLKNLSKTTARFNDCPAYVTQLAPSGGVQVYNLNCAAAHPLRPGGSEVFAIELRVPKTAPIGANGLFWELDPWGIQGPQLHARVTIER